MGVQKAKPFAGAQDLAISRQVWRLNGSAEGTGSGGPGTTALCRGSGPRIRGMQKRVPKNPFFLFSPPPSVLTKHQLAAEQRCQDAFPVPEAAYQHGLRDPYDYLGD